MQASSGQLWPVSVLVLTLGEHKGASFYFISTCVHIHLSADIYIRLSRGEGRKKKDEKKNKWKNGSLCLIYDKQLKSWVRFQDLTASCLNLQTNTILRAQQWLMLLGLSIKPLSLIWPIYPRLGSRLGHSVLECRMRVGSRQGYREP